MDTPICDFVNEYVRRGGVRMHMPGHKGVAALGPEPMDITEIAGADEIFASRGIIRKSEENAAALFGARRTVYSAEGSSLCVRAMVYLACLRAAEKGIPKRILAGRNAHRAFVAAAALADIDVDWIYPGEAEGLLSCTVTPEEVARRLREREYAAVYVTSPDYTGRMADIRGIAEVCRAHGVPFLADNAHGAYLKFLKEDLHPMTLGADVCCDSAHKTLDCLTGAAYLHIAETAPEGWAEAAEAATGLFGSTSPNWLILQSLDRMNRELSGEWPGKLRRAAERVAATKERLRREGWELAGGEPMKITLLPKGKGLTGDEAHDLLRENGIECEFSDPDYLVLMPGVNTAEEEFQRVEKALRKAGRALPRRGGDSSAFGFRMTPNGQVLLREAEKVCSIREAMFSPAEGIPAEDAEGRIMAGCDASCPPAVPVVIPGERITKEAIDALRYYGKEKVTVMK